MKEPDVLKDPYYYGAYTHTTEMMINFREEKQKAIDASWNVHDDIKNQTLNELRDTQERDSLPYAICILNLFGDLNVGIILRTAALCGAEKVFIVGRKKYDRRSTVGADKYLNVEYVPDVIDPLTSEIDVKAFHEMLGEYDPVFVEQGGMSIQTFIPRAKQCFIFGNEGTGIPETLLDDQRIISLDQRGVIRSYNVSSAASIVLYHVSSKIWYS